MHVNALKLDYINHDIEFWQQLKPYTVIEWFNTFNGGNFGDVGVFSPHVYRSDIIMAGLGLYEHSSVLEFAKELNLTVCDNHAEDTSYQRHEKYYYERSITNYSKMKNNNWRQVATNIKSVHWIGPNVPGVFMFLGRIIPFRQGSQFGSHLLVEVFLDTQKYWMPMFNHTFFGLYIHPFINELE